jgi:hypothetical protein
VASYVPVRLCGTPVTVVCERIAAREESDSSVEAQRCAVRPALSPSESLVAVGTPVDEAPRCGIVRMISDEMKAAIRGRLSDNQGRTVSGELDHRLEVGRVRPASGPPQYLLYIPASNKWLQLCDCVGGHSCLTGKPGAKGHAENRKR